MGEFEHLAYGAAAELDQRVPVVAGAVYKAEEGGVGERREGRMVQSQWQSPDYRRRRRAEASHWRRKWLLGGPTSIILSRLILSAHCRSVRAVVQ